MLDRFLITVWVVWSVWLYSVSGAVRVTMFRSPLVWSSQLGEFVIARDFEHNTDALTVRIHPKIGPIGQAGFREPFYQLPQFEYYPYDRHHFDRRPIGGDIGDEELLHSEDYESESNEVSTLTQHPVESLEDTDESDSELFTSEIGPSFRFIRSPRAWVKNLLSNSNFVEKKPARMYLPLMTADDTSADKEMRFKRSVLPDRFLKSDNDDSWSDDPRRSLAENTADVTIESPENNDEKTNVTEQTSKITQSQANPIQQTFILSKRNNNTLVTKQSLEDENKISLKFERTRDAMLPNPRAFPVINNKFGRKTRYTPVLESARPLIDTLRRDSQKLPEARPATPDKSEQDRSDLYKNNFYRLVQASHAVYPRKNQNTENIRGTMANPRKDNRILKRSGHKHHDSIHDKELPIMYPHIKYSGYNGGPEATPKNTQENFASVKTSTIDPNDSNRVPKGADKNTPSRINYAELSTRAVSTSTSTTSSTTTTTSSPRIVLSASLPWLTNSRYNTIQPPSVMTSHVPARPEPVSSSTSTTTSSTTTTARPDIPSASLPPLNSYRYNNFQPPPVMVSYIPARPEGYPAYEHKPLARPTGFSSNVVRWFFQSFPLPIHL